MEVRRLTSAEPDIAVVVEQLNSADWDDFDHPFSEQSLRGFLGSDEHFYLVAEANGKLAGALHAYLLLHPAGHSVVYIDEVDTAKPYRRQGVATALMHEMLRLAAVAGAAEAWLGTEDDNEPAKALYRKLKPYEEEHGPIFSYKVK
jgi:ribosomal protein S18 acetylase RimI-like enzyme